jgi:hypothetical protein
MNYEVAGTINLYPTMRLKLEAATHFSSPSGIKITVSSTNGGDLTVQMTLEADEDSLAREMAVIELNRICNLLSYFYDIPISGSQITGIVSVVITPEGKHVRISEVGIGIDAIVALVKGLDPESTQQLVHRLEKEYPPDFEDVISMWREAISIEAPAMKYLLLYRLMEFLFTSNTKALTDWIMSKEPTVQIFQDRRRKCKVTIYTYLRDSIHPKQKMFPIGDIHNSLPRLQNLAKEAIEEKFGYVHPYEQGFLKQVS